MEREIKYQEILSFRREVILKLISFYFIFLFVYTGFSKLMDTKSLFTALRNAPLFLTTTFAAFLSWVVAIAEILLAIMVGFKKTSYYGWLGVIMLLTIFTIYTAWIVFVSHFEPCTCGGLMTLLSWKQHLIFNISSLGTAFWAYRLHTKKIKT